MSQLDVRQDKPYRRGLILGLTMAEIMILIIFLLLMALTAALANRDEQIRLLSNGSDTQKLVAALQQSFPDAQTPEEMVKELRLAADAQQRVAESVGSDKLTDQFLRDAALGGEVRKIAKKAEVADPEDLVRMAAVAADKAKGSRSTDQFVKDAAVGAQARKMATDANVSDPLDLIRKVTAESKSSKKGQWPPFINLSEAGGYYFESGSAQLKPQFEKTLRTTTIEKLLEIVQDYDVDVIEVIGHTDEVPMVGVSNLDKMLISAVRGSTSAANLQSTDNAGLALARAASVTQVLKTDKRLQGVTILPMSAAQMIQPVDKLADGKSAGDDRSRRRIEIRVRRSTQEAVDQGRKAIPRPTERVTM